MFYLEDTQKNKPVSSAFKMSCALSFSNKEGKQYPFAI